MFQSHLNGSEGLTKSDQSNSLTLQMHDLVLWDKHSRHCNVCLLSHGLDLHPHDTLEGAPVARKALNSHQSTITDAGDQVSHPAAAARCEL